MNDSLLRLRGQPTAAALPLPASSARCDADIKVREPDFAHLVKTGRTRYEAPRFMSVNQAVAQLLEVEGKRRGGVCTRDSMAVGLARVGQDTQRIVSGTLGELERVDFGPPLHSLVLVAPSQHVHDLEAVMLQRFRVKEGVTPMLPPPAPADDASSSDSDGESGAAASGGGAAGGH